MLVSLASANCSLYADALVALFGAEPRLLPNCADSWRQVVTFYFEIVSHDAMWDGIEPMIVQLGLCLEITFKI